MTTSRAVAALLLISAMLLISLAPGGPVETRDFSHIPTLILGLFNVFLTVLGLGSILLSWLVYRRRSRWVWPFLAGVGYFVVYGLDLLAIFPVSPTAMNQALWAIEVGGMIVACPLMILSSLGLRHSDGRHSDALMPRAAMVAAAVSGLAIVVFTTISAMGG